MIFTKASVIDLRDLLVSKVWKLNPDVFRVWAVLLAYVDREGLVRGDSEWLAKMTDLSVESVESALGGQLKGTIEVVENGFRWVVAYQDSVSRQLNQYRNRQKKYAARRTAERGRNGFHGQEPTASVGVAIGRV